MKRELLTLILIKAITISGICGGSMTEMGVSPEYILILSAFIFIASLVSMISTKNESLKFRKNEENNLPGTADVIIDLEGSGTKWKSTVRKKKGEKYNEF